MAGSFILSCDLEQFEACVIEASHQKPILLDLWAQWCAPCLVIAPILAKVVEKHQGAVQLVKVDVDEGENMKIAGRYQVRGFPSVLLIKNGEEQNRFYGAQTQSFVEAFLQPYL